MKSLNMLFLLGVIGLVLSGYLVGVHYLPVDDSRFCEISEYFSCDTVSKSSYAVFMGVPVAIMGVVFYLVVVLVSLGLMDKFDYKKIVDDLKERDLKIFLFVFSLIGFGFSLYLTYLELFIIDAVCIFCVVSLVLVSVILLIARRELHL